jgi:hypothetical protein
MRQTLLRQEAQEFDSADFASGRSANSASYSAREVLQKLSEIKSGKCYSIDTTLLQYCSDKGLIDRIEAVESERLANLVVRQASLAAALEKQEDSFRSCIKRIYEIDDRLNSRWFRIKSICAPSEKVLLTTEQAALSYKKNTIQLGLDKEKTELEVSQKAAKTLSSYVCIDGEYCKATDAASDLLKKLSPREVLFGTKSIEQALELYLKERQVFSEILDNFLEAKMALEKSVLAKPLQRNLSVLALISAEKSETFVERLTDLTNAFTQQSGSSLSEVEAFRLACLSYKKKGTAGTVVRDLAGISKMFGTNLGFLEYLSAIKLSELPSKQRAAITSADIEKIKLSFKEVISETEMPRLLLQLLAIPAQYHREIPTLMQRLRTEHAVDNKLIASAAVALIGAGFSEDDLLPDQRTVT